MTKWWNDDEYLERNLRRWFENYDFTCWLSCDYEIFIGSKDIRSVWFTISNNKCYWHIVYSNNHSFPIGTFPVKSVSDIITKFRDITYNPFKYRTKGR